MAQWLQILIARQKKNLEDQNAHHLLARPSTFMCQGLPLFY
jgi:hypothetical protein